MLIHLPVIWIAEKVNSFTLLQVRLYETHRWPLTAHINSTIIRSAYVQPVAKVKQGNSDRNVEFLDLQTPTNWQHPRIEGASHANFPDWQECTGHYGNKHYFGDFQVLGCQPGSEISCAVHLYNEEAIARTAEARQVVCKSTFCTLFRQFSSARMPT